MIEKFDTEEEAIEQLKAAEESASRSDGSNVNLKAIETVDSNATSHLSAFLSGMPAPSIVQRQQMAKAGLELDWMDKVPALTDHTWDTALEVGNFVHTFRDLLDMNKLDINRFVASLQFMEQVPPVIGESKDDGVTMEVDGDDDEVENDDENEAKSCDDGDVDKDDDDDDAGDAEAKSTSENDPGSGMEVAIDQDDGDNDDMILSNATQHMATTSKSEPLEEEPEKTELNAEAELDRLQLCALQFVLDDLHVLLDLTDESEESMRKENKGAGRVGVARLPLNQLTWQELARMLCVTKVMHEGGRGYDDVLHAVRGANPNPALTLHQTQTSTLILTLTLTLTLTDRCAAP